MTTRTTTPELEPLARKLIGAMSETFGGQYVRDFLLPHVARPLGVPRDDQAAVCAGLADPVACLRTLYSHYAFARRGKARGDLSTAGVTALQQMTAEHGEKVFGRPGSEIWHRFQEALAAEGANCNETQDRGVVQGLFELAAELGGQSIATWIVRGAETERKIEAQFMRIVDIRGLGPKGTSTFVRDVVYLYEIEDKIEAVERIHIQPVDRWLRLIVREVVPEDGMDHAADWVIAGKVNKYCRRAGVSGVLFNMGCTYFGQKTVREVERFDAEISRLKASLG